ncbi:MAG: hypothetical protein F4Y77_12475, partial [Holophagales bacterium]|nr:hypothetical protein [Holophagales bacterium]
MRRGSFAAAFVLAAFAAAAPADAQMTPTLPSGCGAGGGAAWFSGVTSDSSSITVTFATTLPSSSSGNLKLCQSNGTFAIVRTSDETGSQLPFAPTTGGTKTIEKVGRDTTADDLSPATDYWITFQPTSGASSSWMYIRTKSTAGPTITITGGSAVTEGTAAVFTVTANPAPTADLPINLTVSESGGDYVATTDEGSKMVTITSGSTTATYSVTTQGDTTDEDTGTVTVTVATGTGYSVGTTSSANVTVNDDDAPAAVPTSAKLVSTTGQTATNINALADIAQAFTTGSNSGGYVLTRVDWKFKRDGTSPITLANLVAEIRQDSSGNPGAVVATLTDPASLPSDGLAEFTAPGDGILLAANTTYFAVFDVSTVSTDDVYQTASDAEDTGAATGWSIADSRLRRAISATSWASPTTNNNNMMIAVHGYSVAPKLVGNTSQSLAGSQTAVHDWAQPFTTGSNATGYKLTRADIRMLGGSGTAPTYTVSVHKDSSSSPGDSLGTLTNPAAWPSSAGLARHFAPGGGINLAANTTYWLVYDITANASNSPSKWLTYRTTEDDEDTGASAGWSIGNDNRDRTWNTTTWGSPFPESRVLALHGNPRSPMVSNTGQTLTNDVPFGSDRAQQFTTGSGTGGYKLTGVDLRLKSSATTAPVYSVSIQGDSSSSPDGTALGTLTTSATLTASYALVEFAASGSGITLAADTDYWVVIDVSTGDADTDVQGGGVPNEDEGARPGWTIGNGHRWRVNSATTWGTTTSPTTVGIAVYGTPVDQTAPTFQSATVNGTALSVTFNENLDSGSRPVGSAFAVSGGRSGTGMATISGATVSVTLDSAVAGGGTVTVSYSPPDGSKLRDAAGNFAPGFADQAVTNQPAPALPSGCGTGNGAAWFKG